MVPGRRLASALALLVPAAAASLACSSGDVAQPLGGFPRNLATSSWKVGLYTGSSMSVLASEGAALQSAGASRGLQLYLNYGDFRNFEGSPSVGAGIVDVPTLNQNGQQLVLAFEPTNASFCTHYSVTTKSATGGCRLSDLTATAPNHAQVAAAYANIVALANALDQPLILRFGSEMNADWDDWDYGYDATNNTPADFIAAWEYAHHVIVPAVASGHSVLFAYAPNNHSYDQSTFGADAVAFWPGSAQVEIIGLDGYSTANSFSADFDAALKTLEGLGNQPMMLAEFAASTSVDGGRVAWLTAAAADLQTHHPRVQYMNWFDNDASHPYQLSDTDAAGRTLYATFAQVLLNGGASAHATGSGGGAGGSTGSGGGAGGSGTSSSGGTSLGGSCATTSDCTGGDASITEYCSADGVCLTTLGADCSPGGAAYDSLCNGGQPGEQEVCSSSTRTCIQACHSDNDCPSAASHCDTSRSPWSCVAPPVQSPAGGSGGGSSGAGGSGSSGAGGGSGGGSSGAGGGSSSGGACLNSELLCSPGSSTCCDPSAACQANSIGVSTCCIADGSPSTSGNGRDCCSGSANYGSDGICGDAATAPVQSQCVPDGQSSVAGDGTDCCTGTGDYNTASGICGQAGACVPDGSASVVGDGSDCCSGNFNSDTGLCGG